MNHFIVQLSWAVEIILSYKNVLLFSKVRLEQMFSLYTFC